MSVAVLVCAYALAVTGRELFREVKLMIKYRVVSDDDLQALLFWAIELALSVAFISFLYLVLF